MARPSEDELIARYFAPLATLEGSDGLTDDAALIAPPPGRAFVATLDALVETVHFLSDDPPDLVARKALRVNLSDLAAKGARPYGFMLSLALPKGWTEEWLAGFSAGLAADSAHFRCPLVGGDTVSTPGPLCLSITAFGTVPEGAIPRRRGGRPGDLVFVSGTIGDGALGLAVRLGREATLTALDEAQRAHLVSRHLVPEPRVALADLVLRHASAAMDVSDGLAGDLAKLCRASAVTATVDLDAVPLSEPARRACEMSPALFDLAMTGGEDYEILCAVAPAEANDFCAGAARIGVPLARIGTLEAGEGEPVFLRSGIAHRFTRMSFSHF